MAESFEIPGLVGLEIEAGGKVEYIVVADRDSKVLLSTTVWGKAVKMANLCRAAGGEVTIFKATKG